MNMLYHPLSCVSLRPRSNRWVSEAQGGVVEDCAALRAGRGRPCGSPDLSSALLPLLQPAMFLKSRFYILGFLPYFSLPLKGKFC